MHKKNGKCSFLPDGTIKLHESIQDKTRESWLMLLARRGQDNSTTLCWGINNTGASFARIGTQEGDLINGFVHEDPYKTRLLGQYLYLVDEDKNYFTNSWYPVLNKDQELETTFKFGSLRQKTSYTEIEVQTDSFIPNAFDGLIQLITIKNNSKKARKLKLFAVNPVNIGDARGIQFAGFNSLMLGGAFHDEALNGTVWRSNFGISYDSEGFTAQENHDATKEMFGKLLLHTSSEKVQSYSTKYEDFVGHYSNTMANPEGLFYDSLRSVNAEELTSALSVLEFDLSLKAGEEKTITVSSVMCTTADYYVRDKAEYKAALAIANNPKKAKEELAAVMADWEAEFAQNTLSIPGLDVVSHSFKWLQYQCAMVSCLNRMKSRFHSGFEYGFGFRDILQDLLAILPYDNDKVKEILHFVAKQMFSDGNVYHNFYVSAPGTTDFNASDDPLWFILAVCEYIKETHDFAILEERAPFADLDVEKTGTIYEHLDIALRKVWRFSVDGLPLLFDADWNDDLSSYPDHLSVMTAQILYKSLVEYKLLVEALPESSLSALKIQKDALLKDLVEKTETVSKSINDYCIDEDGSYIRLLGPNKDASQSIGSSKTDGLIFFEPIAWSGYSGQATKEQFDKAYEVCEKILKAKGGYRICQGDKRLVNKELPRDYTAWKRSAPGKKENGGMFRHLESWYIASLCKFGYGDKAFDIFYKTLPFVCSEDDPYNYAAERFVYPEYVSGPDSNEFGRAGHTWLTGTAPTRHKTIMESVFGIQPVHEGLKLDPCVPKAWKTFSAKRTIKKTVFNISYENPNAVEKGVVSLSVDGEVLPSNIIPLVFFDGKEHEVKVVMG